MWNAELDDDQRALLADLFEASLIEVIQEIAEKMKLKKGEFARHAWPEASPQVARNRWNAMRTVDHRTGRPTNCTLSDAYRMASTLGLQMAYVTLQAEHSAEQKFEQLNQAGHPQPQAVANKRKRSRNKQGDIE